MDARESQLCGALLDAYPTRDEFAEVLFEIEKDLDTMVTSQMNLELTVKRVVRTAKRQGWLADLERAAMEGNPGNPALLAWYDSYCVRLVAPPQVAAPVSAQPDRIFVSYRRDDTAYPCGWLFDKLAQHFGRDQVFKDIDSIQLGDDFAEVITTAVERCDVLLALIGRQWLTVSDDDGHRRLDNPNDFVRLEIEAAISRNVRIIPILVEGARMPRTDELPPSLAKLARRQALELSSSRFDFDTNRLLKVLKRILTGAQALPIDPEGDPPELPNTADISIGNISSGRDTKLDIHHSKYRN